jgi:molybdopterin/thiamine biosynthesis adenylyltransferase
MKERNASITPQSSVLSPRLSRYQRQALLPQIGAAGQERLSRSRVLLVGCGALGCHAADQLVRGGIGHLRLVDRDIVELTNLQRQTLFDEQDAQKGAAKTEAAAARLSRINSSVEIEPLVADVWAGNVEDFLDGIDLILDGTDNVQTRYLLNDISVKHGIPWIHAACVGTEGRVMAIVPGITACLRCVFPTPPEGRELPTCDTAGVLQAAAATAASLQVAQAFRILPSISPSPGTPGEGRGEGLKKNSDSVGPHPNPLPEYRERGQECLLKFDVWSGRFASIDLQDARRSDCPCCGKREFEFLRIDASQSAISLCGRNAVQIRPARKWSGEDFAGAIHRLEQFGEMESRAFFSRCPLRDPAGITITCFKDGRIIVDGTTDARRARSVCARFIGE